MNGYMVQVLEEVKYLMNVQHYFALSQVERLVDYVSKVQYAKNGEFYSLSLLEIKCTKQLVGKSFSY